MSATTDIITVPTSDTPGTSLVLRSGARRYVFGRFAEGTQRALVEQGQGRLTSTAAFFITGPTAWEGIGGLFGMILSMADATAFAEEAARAERSRRVGNAEREAEKIAAKGRAVMEKAVERGEGEVKLDEVRSTARAEETKANEKLERLKKEEGDADMERQSLDIFGAKNIIHAIATARRFVFRKGLPLYAHEVKKVVPSLEGSAGEDDGEIPPTWKDDSIRVWAMAIEPERPQPAAAAATTMTRTTATTTTTTMRRKRSIHEVNGEDTDTGTRTQTDNIVEMIDADEVTSIEQQHEIDDAVRAGVVADMFRSNWSLDQLVELPISQVRLPATLFVRRTNGGKGLEEYKGPMPGDADFEDVKVWTRKPWPGALIRELPPTAPSSEAASYIVLGYTRPPKMDKKKLELYGIKGPMIKDLISGGTVKAKDGEQVTLDMVTAPPEPAKGVAVIDLPTEEYVQPMLARPEWNVPEIKTGIVAIFWILGPGVSKSSALREFMRQRTDVEHVVSAPELCADELTMESAAKSAARMSVVDAERFQVPLYDNRVPLDGGDDGLVTVLKSSDVDVHAAVHAAKRGLGVDFSPKFALRTGAMAAALDTKQSDDTKVSSEVQDLAQKALDAIKADEETLKRWRQSVPCPDTEIITLGTGSALPSKYRNVSSTLLRVPGVGSYLFDAGENTLGQLRRVFSPAELEAVFAELKMIWISHLHADHHLGTASVIRAWRDAVHPPSSSAVAAVPLTLSAENLTPENLAAGRRLAVVSDTGMLNWLAEYSHVEDFGYSHIFPLYIFDAARDNPSRLYLRPGIPSGPDNDTIATSFVIDPSLYPALLGLSDIQSVHVKHCHGAKAVSLTFESGFKASYSGDCRPSKEFARIGKDSTVLIHEATFDDELAGEARAKAHSTTSEALAVGAAMGAKAVVLTHFSQRYQKIPVMDTWEIGGDDDVGAEDGRMEAQGGPDRPINLAEDKIVLGAMMDIAEDISHAALKHGGPTLGDPHQFQERSQPDPVASATTSPAEQRAKLKTRDMQVCVAFDYMRVRVGDIALMKHFTPALVRLFEEREEEKEREKEGNRERARQSLRDKEARREENLSKMKGAKNTSNKKGKRAANTA